MRKEQRENILSVFTEGAKLGYIGEKHVYNE